MMPIADDADFDQEKHHDEDWYMASHLGAEKYIVPVIFAFIFVVGILGNGTLIFIYSKHATMRNVANTYILHLAISDIFIYITTVPFLSAVYALGTWPFGILVCRLAEFGRDLSTAVSIFIIACLAADRYLASVARIPASDAEKQHGGAGIEGQRSGVVAGFVWASAGFLSVPALALSEVKDEVLSDTKVVQVCTMYPTYLGEGYAQANVFFKFLAFYIIPIFIVCCLYLLMARHLSLGRLMAGDNELAQRHRRHQLARRKVAQVVLALFASFVVCLLFHHVFLIWFHFDPDAWQSYSRLWHAIRIVAFCLVFVSACLNPVLLYWLSPVYRAYFNHHLFGLCCRHLPHHTHENKAERDAHSLALFEETAISETTSISDLHAVLID